jgi:hypothetical protein
VFVELLNGVDESQIDDKVGLVGLKLWGKSLWWRSFSETLQRVGRRLTGRYDVGALGGLPGFKRSMI